MADNFNISDIPPEAGPKSVEVPGDIADGVAGEIMSWDAAGVAANTGPGAAMEVLTSNGAGTLPTFQAAAGAPVASVFTRIGAVVAAASDYDASQVDNDSGVGGAFVDDALDILAGAITGLDSTDIANVSGVVGATVTAALNTLDGATAPVDSVFARIGAVVAAASDYDASQVDNDSSIAGAFVDDALNNLDNAAAQARRTTAFTLPTVFGDISLDTTDNESNAAIIDHEAGTPDNITLVLAGLYEIHYHFEVGPSSDVGSGARIEARVRVNDTTVLNGSLQYTMIHNDSSLESQNHVDGLACSFLYQATAADFVTLQAQMVITAGTPDPDLLASTIVMTAKRLTQ